MSMPLMPAMECCARAREGPPLSTRESANVRATRLVVTETSFSSCSAGGWIWSGEDRRHDTTYQVRALDVLILSWMVANVHATTCDRGRRAIMVQGNPPCHTSRCPHSANG